MCDWGAGSFLFLFFTNHSFIEWALRTAGIRLIPDTLGAESLKAFVFLVGLSTLLAFWRDAVPAPLSTWLPAGVSWTFVAGVALGFGALRLRSMAIVRKLLPRAGLAIAPSAQNRAILAVMGAPIALTLLVLVLIAP